MAIGELLVHTFDIVSGLGVEVGRALRDGIPESSLVILPGVGHLSSVEGAARFNREVRSFLQNNRD
jgi:pimeloyl-ACP methyl ester carboxylesterase